MDYIINSRTKKVEIFCETSEEIQEITQVLSNYKTAGIPDEISFATTNPAIIHSKIVPLDNHSTSSSISSSNENTGVYY